MKKLRFRLGLMLLALCLLASCKDTEDVELVNESEKVDSMVVDMLPETKPIVLTVEQRAYAQKNNDFTFNLYRAINQADNRKSNITSPLSATFALGMLNDGAAGTTVQEITKILGFGNDRDVLNAYCQTLLEQAPYADPSVILYIANIVAANKQVTLESTFNNDMLNYYQAEVASLDFSKPSSIDYLNNWSKEKSNGMIPQIIDHIDPNTLLILMNAIYFKATWTDKFDEKDTQMDTFTKSDGKTIQLPMMHRNARVLYHTDNLFSSVCLPFGSGDKYNMYILLPSEGKTVDDIISSLSNDLWEHSKEETMLTIVDLEIPRFSTNSDITLNDMIIKLGAPSIFDPYKADFSGVSKNYERLYVSLIKQKAAIEVSEEGTKTSAVTVEAMIGSDISKKVTADFHAERPFVYLIQEHDTNAIFFIGTFRGE